MKNNDLGKADIFIDNKLQEMVDCYSNIKLSQLLFYKDGLSNTVHTIKVVPTKEKNEASSGTSIINDYISYVPGKAILDGLDMNRIKISGVIDDVNDSVTYKGNWGAFNGDDRYANGTCHVGNDKTGSIEYTFKGTKIEWYGLKNSDLGYANIYIDNKLKAKVDCYSTNNRVSKLFSIDTLRAGTHTIKITVSGKKASASAGTYIVHDYFSLGTALTMKKNDASSNAIDIYGNWDIEDNTMYYDGSAYRSNESGSFLETAFSGTSIDWYGLKANDLGIAKVYIDDQPIQDVDCYSKVESDQLLFSKTGLSSGNHRIRIEVTGSKNSRSKDCFIVHDYFVADQIAKNILAKKNQSR